MLFLLNTAQKMNFSIKDFFSKYDQIFRKFRIWPHLLEEFFWKTLTLICYLPPDTFHFYWCFFLLNRQIILITLESHHGTWSHWNTWLKTRPVFSTCLNNSNIRKDLKSDKCFCLLFIWLCTLQRFSFLCWLTT